VRPKIVRANADHAVAAGKKSRRLPGECPVYPIISSGSILIVSASNLDAGIRSSGLTAAGELCAGGEIEVCPVINDR
jgi:hypothetical protein